MATDWTQPFYARDVNGDRLVTPNDVLVSINELNARRLIADDGTLPDRSNHPDAAYYDVNGDGALTSADVLTTINALNQDTRGPAIFAGLSRDTAPNDETNEDGITSNAELSGIVEDDLTGVAALSAQIDGGPARQIAVAADGSFTIDPALPGDGSGDGVHIVRLTAVDARQNISDIVEVRFTLDTTLPSPPKDVALTPDTDSGHSELDAVTNHPRPQIQGQAEAGSVVTVFVDGVAVGEANGDDSWTLDPVSLTDGVYTVTATSQDPAGNVSRVSEPLQLVIDRRSPTVVEAPHGTVPQTSSSLTIRFDEPASHQPRTGFELRFKGGEDDGRHVPIRAIYPGVSAINATRIDFDQELADLTYELSIPSTDLAGNLVRGATVFEFSVDDIPSISALSPAHGERMVNVARETVVRFDEPIDPATVDAESFYLFANGENLPGRIRVSTTERFATFFYDEPLPPSTAVRVVVEGDRISSRDGSLLDADGDGQPGGTLISEFRTLPLSRIPGTNVFGFVRDSYTGEPIVGATIRVDAFPEANVITDESGRFELVDMPAPDFFVHIDGSTANSTPESFYPNVGKPFHSVPGETVQLEMGGEPFDIYLPPIASSDGVPLSPSASTDVVFGEAGMAELEVLFPDVDSTAWDLLRLTIGANAAVDDSGDPATSAAIIPVDPNRIPAPLPGNLDPSLVVSIQAAGATSFDIPAAIQFPNLESLAAGEKSLIYSFDHDAGAWKVVGTGTVSQDESTIVSDGGVIQAPGWHFNVPGTPGTVVPFFPPFCTTLEAGVELSGEFQPLEVGIDFEAQIGDLNDDLAPPILVDEVPLPNFPDLGIPPADTFTWWMGERVISNADGRIVIPNTTEYANPSGFPVHFAGSDYRMNGGAIPDSVRFAVELPTGRPVRDAAGNPIVPTPIAGSPGEFSAFLPQGTYEVTLTANRGPDEERVTQTIRVRDILVVALGDSASSGEGNPEVTRTNLKPAEWAAVDGSRADLADERDRQHNISHRSSWAASAQLALQMEQLDPHTSVTFVFVSASGGEISEGALGPYAGIGNAEGHDEGKPMIPQLDQIDAIVQDRTIDVMTISLGINDIGFANVVASLLFADPDDPDLTSQEYQQALDFLKQSVDTGDPAALESFVNTVFPDLTGFYPPAAEYITQQILDPTTVGFNNLIDNNDPQLDDYDDLNTRIRALQGGAPAHIYITEYPNPLTEVVDGTVVRSAEIATDVMPSWVEEYIFRTELEIGGEEIDWAVDNVLNPLNDSVARAAGTFGWQYVDGIADAFLGHGYNGDEPFDAHGNPINAETARWIVTATESARAQGPLSTILGGIITDPFEISTIDTKGTLHPNRLGHRAIKERLYDHVKADLALASPVAVSFRVDSGTIAEMGGAATLRATLSAPHRADVVLSFDYSGSAEEGLDYRASAQQIVIPAGEVSGTLTLSAIDDVLAEPGPDETVIVSLTKLRIGSQSIDRSANVARVAITDNDSGEGEIIPDVLKNPLKFSGSKKFPESPIEFSEAFSVQFPNPLGFPIPEFRIKVAELEARARLEGKGDLDATVEGKENAKEVVINGQIDAELNASASIEVSGLICKIPLVGDFLCDEYDVDVDLGDSTIDFANETFDLPVESPVNFRGEVLAMATLSAESTFHAMAELYVRCTDPLFPPGLTFFDNLVQLLSRRANTVAGPQNDVAAPMSNQAGFGTEDTIYYRYVLDELEIAGTAGTETGFTATLPSETDFELYVYAPLTNRSIRVSGRSGQSGQIDSLSLPVAAFGGLDTDLDGLPDVGEIAMGTNWQKADTDDDGLLDSSEIENGLDPLGGRAFPTGVIATLPLLGSANEVTVTGTISEDTRRTAYLATGAHGLAIVDASQFNNPIVLGQLALPGDATDVGVDRRHERAVVAANQGGLHFVDVSDPMLPQRLSTADVSASRVEVVDGIAYVVAGTQLRSYSVLTGERIGVITLSESEITDLALAGPFAYVMDASRQLHVIELGFLMRPRGTLVMPGSGGKLFAADGVVYAAAATTGLGGFVTADVSDPDEPTLLGRTQAPEESAPRTDVVANGSGRAILVGTAARQTNDPPLLQLVDLNQLDPPDHSYRPFPRIELAAPPRDVSLASGIAFVAAGTAGLQVVNYLPFDNRLEQPTVSIDELEILDEDPAMAGIQVQEGSVVAIPTTIRDDVQIRNVELLVDGTPIQNDLAFPFDLAVTIPRLEAGGATVTVEVRATDTGGNARTSAPLALHPVPDSFAPSIVDVNFENGARFGRSFRTIRIAFDEVMDPDTLNSDNVQLTDLQNPNRLLAAEDMRIRLDGRELLLTYPRLTPSDYRLTIQTASVADRVGNPIGGENFTRDLTIVEGTAVWLSDESGFWDDPLNWQDGKLPNSDDDVFIPSLSPDTEITIPNSGIDVRSLFFGGDFRIAGGAWRVQSTVQAAGTLTIGGGAIRGALILPGVDGSDLEVTGDVTFQDVTLRANTKAVGSPTITLLNSVNTGVLTVTEESSLGLGGEFTLAQLGELLASERVVQLKGTLNLQDDALTTGGEFGNWQLVGGAIRGGRVQGASTQAALEFSSRFSNLLDGVTVETDLYLDSGDDLRIFNGITLNATATLEGSAELYFVRPDDHDDPYEQLLAGRGEIVFTRVDTGSNNRVHIDDNVTLTIGGQMTLRGGNVEVVRRGRSGVEDVASLVNLGTIEADLTDLAQPFALNPTQWQNRGTIRVAAGAMLQLGGSFTLADMGDFQALGGEVGVIGSLDLSGATLTVGSSLGSWHLNGGAIRGGTINGAGESDALEFNGNFNNLLHGVTVNTDLHLGSFDDLRIFSGLTLNGTATLEGNAGLYFVRPDEHVDPYEQLLDGTGEIVFSRDATGSDNQVHIDDNVTLTVGESMTLRGGNVEIVRRGRSGVEDVAVLINRGTLAADLADLAQPMILNPSHWENRGTITVAAESMLRLGGSFAWSDLGRLDASGGVVGVIGNLDLTGETLITGGSLGDWQLAGGTIRGGTVNAAAAGDALEVTSHFSNLLDAVILNADLHLDSFDDLRIFNGLTLNGRATLAGNAGLYFVRPDDNSDPYEQRLGGTGELLFSRVATGSDNRIHIDDQVTLVIGPSITLHGGNLEILRRGRAGVDDVAALINEGTISADLADMTQPMILNPSHWENRGTLHVAADAMLQLGGTFSRSDLGTLDASGGVVGLIGNLDLSGETLTIGGTHGSWQLAGGTIRGGTVNAAGAGEALRFNGSINNLLDGVTVNIDLHLDSGDDLRIFNGLTLNGTATLEGNAALYFVRPNDHADPYEQLLGGSGEIVFNRLATGSDNRVHVDDNVTLTIGAGMTLRGGNVAIVRRGRAGVPDVAALINEGVIMADLLDETFRIDLSTFVDNGTATEENGGLLVIVN